MARRDERGDTLVEVLVAMVIIGLSATAILGSLLISTNNSSQHRYLANDDTLARSALDMIKQQVELPAQLSQAKFSECSAANSAQTILSTWTAGLVLPTNPYSGNYQVAIDGVQCFSGPNPVQADAHCYWMVAGGDVSQCGSSDSTGLLDVTVSVKDPSDYTLTMSTIVRNPVYNASYPGEYK